MAVRICTDCEELMQEGYAVEDGTIDYFCSDECMSNHYNIDDIAELGKNVMYHEWYKSECDSEDFFILMNRLRSEPTPSQIADVLNVLYSEDESHYGTQGVLSYFIDYLNEQGMNE